MNIGNCRPAKIFDPTRIIRKELSQEFFGSAVNTLRIVVTAIGAGIGIWGIINLLEGYGQDNSGAKSQGIKQLMAGGGVVIIAQTLIPLLANMFN